MEPWKLYAIGAAIFAGLTSVAAKAGLKDLDADVGNAVRTFFVLGFVLLNAMLWTGMSKSIETLHAAGWKSMGWLVVSALTTALSWICYYRAMKDGTVVYVSLIDKGSVLVMLILSVLLLGEPLTWRVGGGALLIVAGLLVLAGGK